MAIIKDILKTYNEGAAYIASAPKMTERIHRDVVQVENTTLGELSWVWNGTAYTPVRSIPLWRRRFF